MKNKKVSLGKFSCFSRASRKKGISAIVATVLIILITVAAVTIIWAAIIPMISNQLDKGTICLDAVSQVQLVDAGYICKEVNDSVTGYNISFQVKHGAKAFDLAGVQVLISEEGSTTSFEITTGLPGANEEKVLSITDYANTTAAGPDKISIAPIVSVGNTQETCDISATKVLNVC